MLCRRRAHLPRSHRHCLRQRDRVSRFALDVLMHHRQLWALRIYTMQRPPFDPAAEEFARWSRVNPALAGGYGVAGVGRNELARALARSLLWGPSAERGSAPLHRDTSAVRAVKAHLTVEFAASEAEATLNESEEATL